MGAIFLMFHLSHYLRVLCSLYLKFQALKIPPFSKTQIKNNVQEMSTCHVTKKLAQPAFPLRSRWHQKS